MRSISSRRLAPALATLTRRAAAQLITPAERTAGGHYGWDLPVLREQVRRLGRPASEQTAAEDIARVIHAANRELQIVQGDPRPSPPWDEAPEYQVRENVASVAAALADPERTPEQNHQGWYERLIADGWRHGSIKDEVAKTHPDLVPFDQLPEHEKQKDRLFMAIVRALAQRRLAPLDARHTLVSSARSDATPNRGDLSPRGDDGRRPGPPRKRRRRLLKRRDLPAASVKLAQASRSQHLLGQLGRGEPV
jgi:hypothetical protein